MSQLFDPGRHEALAEIPWDAAAVRAAIEQIAIDAHATFTREALWPIHPDDGPPERGPLIGLYFGAAGVVWGLDYRAFAMHAIAQSDAQAAGLNRRRYSLWTGDIGLACYLRDCIDAHARFPTLDVL
jgi:hypothetical protein